MPEWDNTQGNVVWTLLGNQLVANVDGQKVAVLDPSEKLTNRLAFEGVASGVATLDADSRLAQDARYLTGYGEAANELVNPAASVTLDPRTSNFVVLRGLTRNVTVTFTDPADAPTRATSLTVVVERSAYAVTFAGASGPVPAPSGREWDMWVFTCVRLAGTWRWWPAAAPGLSLDVVAPGVPGSVAAVGSDQKVTLTWVDPADADLAGIRVYRGLASGFDPGELVATVAPGAQTYGDSGRANGTALYYRVTAVDHSGNESARSAQVTATPGSVVTGQAVYRASAVRDAISRTQSGYFAETDPLYWTDASAATSHKNALRFGSHNLVSGAQPPQGATILSAKVTVYNHQVQAAADASDWVDIALEQIDSAAQLSSSNDFNTRSANIGSTVRWTYSATPRDAANVSPELQAIVQAIVNRAGWAPASGAMQFFAASNPSSLHTAQMRSGYTGAAGTYPMLVVDWEA